MLLGTRLEALVATLKERIHTVLLQQIGKLMLSNTPRPESTRAFWIQTSDHSFLSLATNFLMKLEKVKIAILGYTDHQHIHPLLRYYKDYVSLLVQDPRQ